MKKVLLLTVLLIASMGLKAQEIHIGAKVGMSYSSFRFSGSEFANGIQKSSKGKLNLSIGLVSEFMLSDQFALAPELYYMGSGDIFERNDSEISYSSTVSNSYINVPVMARYYINNNISFEAGPEFGLLLSSKTESNFTYNGETYNSTEDRKDYINSTNFSLGIGANYKMENGLFFNARYNLGLSNMNKETGEGRIIKKVNAIEVGIGFFFM